MIFSDKDIEFIKQYYPSKGSHYCAQELGTTYQAIQRKASSLGIKSNTFWSKEELEFLKDNYCDKGIDYCIKNLNNRNSTAIQAKAHKLGLKLSTLYRENLYKEKLLAAGIAHTPIETYLGSNIPIKHLCANGHTWRIKPSHVLDGKGCPACCKPGFDPNIPAILYYVKIIKDNEIYYKIDITNRTVVQRFKLETDKKILILNEIQYKLGSLARATEAEILTKFKHKRVNISGFLKSHGNTELFEYDVLGLDSTF